MSETCCDICGVAEDAAQHIYLRAIGKTGRLRCVEDGCGACDLRADLNEARAQYAALAAAHDAAMAEAERQLRLVGLSRENWQAIAATNGQLERLRADAAEAQLATVLAQREAANRLAEDLRASLERSLAFVQELQDRLRAAREDGARSMATFIADDLQWATEGNVTLHPDRLLAAWQTAQNTGVTNDA